MPIKLLAMSEPLAVARYILMNDVDELLSGRRVIAYIFCFFFKQKTAYEISRDWSSDVCSSDLLVSPREDLLGILHLEERFPYDGREEARLVYGTEDPRHPGAEYQLTRGEVLLGGPVDLVSRPPLKGFEPYRLDPTDTRARFQALGWRTVVGFQSQQPIHRAHEYIQKCALEPLDGLLIHPLVGKT